MKSGDNLPEGTWQISVKLVNKNYQSVKRKEHLLKGWKKLLGTQAKKLSETPWWRFKEVTILRNNIRSINYHINKINNPVKSEKCQVLKKTN